MLEWLTLAVLVVLVLLTAFRKGEARASKRPHATPAERRLIAPCEAYGHLERMTSVGRDGYVAQFICDRHCGWTAIRKGHWRW